MLMCTENMPEHQGQECKARIKETNFIKALKLVNTSISPEYSVDMLIGLDVLLNIVNNTVNKEVVDDEINNEQKILGILWDESFSIR